MVKEKPTLSLFFPAKGKVQPKGFEKISINDQVSVVIRGKMTRLEQTADPWEQGRRIGVHITGCEIVGKAKKVSISDALKTARKKV